jgi:TonB family protein
VAGRIGDVEFALGESQLEALRDLASRMTAAGHRAALSSPGGEVTVRTPTRRPGVYAATDVDRRATQRGALRRPPYPTVPLSQRRQRAVVVEFVVDTAGMVDSSTVVGYAAEDSAFVAAVRAVIGDWRFAPAQRDGKVVPQVVVQSIPFDPGKPLPAPVQVDTAGCAPSDLADAGDGVFLEAQVDTMVIPHEGNVSPKPPSVPALQRAGGVVTVQFVVDSRGEIVSCTLRVRQATDPRLEAAVRDAIATWRFEPAKLRGIAVSQLVERQFDFVARR